MAADHDDPGPLEERLLAALAERDQALTDLARAREELESLRLALRSRGEAIPPPYPPGAGLGPPPLRYVLADQANERVKGFLGPLHGLARRLFPREPPR